MEFPSARVTAVELDPDNAAVARRNVARFGSRCEILTGAVWTEDGTVEYSIEPGKEHGARVDAAGTASRGHTSPAWSLNTLLGNDAEVDFMKMDIEGAEAAVLKRNTAWAAKVASLKVECHSPYTVEEAASDLQHLGFEVEVLESHWAAVLAWKPALLAAAAERSRA